MPRRPNSAFTLYRRPDSPIWWVHWVIAGRRHRESTGETDRGKALERAAARWQEAKARAGTPVQPGTIERRLAELGSQLVEEAERSGRADTFARDLEVDLRLHILPTWTAPEQVTSIGWEQLREDLHAEGQSWASVKRIGKHLRQLLRFCKRKGTILSVPEILSPAKELIAGEAAERAAMDRDDRNALLADMRKRGNLRAHRCYSVMYFNLFRKSTIERMKRSWVNFKDRTIKVPPASAKNRKTRVYWLHARAAKAIKEQLAENERADGKVDLGKPIFGKFDHSNVFWGACKRLGLVTFDAETRKITDKRGLTPHHVGRHTAATMLVDAGVQLEDRMAAGGWETVEAAQRYDHEDQVERSKRALRRLR